MEHPVSSSVQEARSTAQAPQQRRSLPLAAVVAAYLVAGTLWVLGRGPVVDLLTSVTPMPRWLVGAGHGLAFVVGSAVVLLLLRRRCDRLEAAAAGAQEVADRLVESEARNHLQATALSGPVNAVLITDRDGTIEWVNAAFEQMSGYPSAVAIGSTPRLLKSGLQDEGFYGELWDTILAGRVWRGQVVNRRSDGELYTVSQTITPVVANNGEVENLVAIHENVTDRVKAARELEASRKRMQALFDHAIDAIVLADDEGRYLGVNPAVCSLTGYSRGELLGMRAADLATADQEPAGAATQFDQFSQAGTRSGTFALRHRDGHVVETEYRAVSNIQPGVHLSILRDVTARNTMLRGLNVADASFRALADDAVDIVINVRVEPDGRMRVDYVNPAVTAVLGYPQERLYDDHDLLLDLFHQRGSDIDDTPSLIPTPARPTRLATVQVQRADGQLLWLEIHSTLTDPSTAPVTIQLVARDVTARFEMTQALEQALEDQLVAAERLRTLDAMKHTFLQNVSHELRTPLTSILGFAHLLAEPDHGLAPADTRQFHGRILDNAQRLQRLLDDLLDADRFARGQVEPQRTPTDVRALIEGVVCEVELADRVLELDLEPISFDLDAPWVERIVANLLHNIARHTPAGTRVWLRARATPAGLELAVDDDGPGIPEADRQRVLEPFEQGDGASSLARPGTGVGLTLVNAVAGLHGGELAITDSPAGGTRVVVTLSHADTARSGSGA